MNIKTVRNIKNNICTTVLSVDSMGSDSLSSEQEIEICNNFPRELIYKNLKFVGRFSLGSNGEPLLISLGEDGEDGDLIKIELINKAIPVNENFVASYQINSSNLHNSELGSKINSKELLAMSKILLFEAVIKNALSEILKEIRSIPYEFETEMIETI